MEQVSYLDQIVSEDVPVREDMFSVDEVLDMVEATILSRPQINCIARHTFTKGLYCRELFMPAGTEIISKYHNTQHQWVALIGRVHVFIKGEGWKLVEAPQRGITEPGTRRVLRTVTDCVWLTFHPTEHHPDDDSEEEILKAVALVEEDIILKRINPLINSSEVREIQ